MGVYGEGLTWMGWVEPHQGIHGRRLVGFTAESEFIIDTDNNERTYETTRAFNLISRHTRGIVFFNIATWEQGVTKPTTGTRRLPDASSFLNLKNIHRLCFTNEHYWQRNYACSR